MMDVGRDAMAADAASRWYGSRSPIVPLNFENARLQYWKLKNMAEAWKPIPIRGVTVPNIN